MPDEAQPGAGQPGAIQPGELTDEVHAEAAAGDWEAETTVVAHYYAIYEQEDLA